MYQVLVERRRFISGEPSLWPCFLYTSAKMFGGPLGCVPNIKPLAALPDWVCVRAVVKAVNGLAEELGLQVQPLQDVLGHAQDRIHWLDLLVAEQGESCHSEQGVEGIHLQNESRTNTQCHWSFNHIYCCLGIGQSIHSAHSYEGRAMNRKKSNNNVLRCYYNMLLTTSFPVSCSMGF